MQPKRFVHKKSKSIYNPNSGVHALYSTDTEGGSVCLDTCRLSTSPDVHCCLSDTSTPFVFLKIIPLLSTITCTI